MWVIGGYAFYLLILLLMLPSPGTWDVSSNPSGCLFPHQLQQGNNSNYFTGSLMLICRVELVRLSTRKALAA